MLITLIVAGYRCFPIHQPAEFTIGAGVTAFVGENNAGKSAAMRLLHDLRPLFAMLSAATKLNDLIKAPSGQKLGDEVRTDDEIEFNGGNGTVEVTVRVSEFGETRDSLPAFPSHLRLSRRRGEGWSAAWADSTGSMLFVDGSDKSYVHNVPGKHQGDAKPIMDAIRALGKAVYIPSNRLTARGGGTSFDAIVGDPLVAEWAQMQGGYDKRKNALAMELESTLSQLFGLPGLQVTPTVGQGAGVQFRISEAGQFRADEIGTGIAQVFSALFTAATKSPSLILIDEPEFSLHPTLQFKFLNELQRHASLGLVLATHNLGLAMNSADRVYAVSRRPGNASTDHRPWSRISSFAQAPDLAAMMGALSYPAYGDAATRHILLVEGPTDQRIIETLLHKLKIGDKVICIHMGGGSTINNLDHARTQLLGVKRLCPRVSCLIDSEATAEGEKGPGRQAFLDLCEELQIRASASLYRATENYLTADACRDAFGERAKAPSPYEPVSQRSHGWTKNQAWRAAALMEPGHFRDVGEFLMQIAGAVTETSDHV